MQAKQLGCHIITVPPSIIEKIEKKVKRAIINLHKKQLKLLFMIAKKQGLQFKFINIKFNNVFLDLVI